VNHELGGHFDILGGDCPRPRHRLMVSVRDHLR